MPRAAKRRCGRHGLAFATKCPRCESERKSRSQYGAELYQKHKWHEASRAYRKVHPFCALCGEPSQCVDHVIPHRGDERLFWDQQNWQALCTKCNGLKARYDNETRKKRGQIVVVTGAPRSGKSRWVQSQRYPGDIVYDLDDILWLIAKTKDIEPKYRHMGQLVRDALVGWWCSYPDVNAFIIVTDYTNARQLADSMRGKLKVVEASEMECIARVRADDRPRKSERVAAVRRWFARFEQCDSRNVSQLSSHPKAEGYTPPYPPCGG